MKTLTKKLLCILFLFLFVATATADFNRTAGYKKIGIVDIGTNTHVQIDTHLGLTNLNAHGATATANLGMGGYTLSGNSTSGGNLTLQSTSHATKGLLLFGTSAYDEVNNRLGIGTTAPTHPFDLKKTTTGAIIGRVINTVAGTATYAQFLVVSDSASLFLHTLSSTYTSSGLEVASGSVVANNGVGGLSVGASHTSGVLRLYAGGVTEMVRLDTTGRVGVGVTSPTAFLHLKAGTATASTAPLKFNSGTLLTTAEAGAIEFLTDAYYGTITTGAARKTFAFLESPIFTGIVTAPNFVSSVATGTQPYAATSTTLNTNLNADLLDGQHGSYYAVANHDQTQTLASGVYTPNSTEMVNLDSTATMTQAQYQRVGSVVTVSGRFTADPTLTATATSFEITLPIASNIGAVEDLAGTTFCGSIAGMGAEINGSIANNTAVIQWVSTDVTSKVWSYTFTYRVL